MNKIESITHSKKKSKINCQDPSHLKYKKYISNKYEKNLSKQIVGIIILYSIIYFIIPFSYENLNYYVFITLFANVDVLSDIFSTSFPDWFDYAYSIDPKNIFSIISTNIISFIAILGIFTEGSRISYNYGIEVGLSAMIIMFLITYLLPIFIIPYIQEIIVKKLENDKKYKNIMDHKKNIMKFITGIIVFLFFLFIESSLLENIFKEYHKKNSLHNFIIDKLLHFVKHIK